MHVAAAVPPAGPPNLTVGNLRETIRNALPNHATFVSWSNTITRQQAALHAILQYLELCGLDEPEWTYARNDLVRGNGRSSPFRFHTMFHNYVVSRLIWNAVTMGQAVTRKIGALRDLKNQPDYNEFTVPLVDFFVRYLNGTSYLTRDYILNSNLQYREQTIIEKMKFGVWSEPRLRQLYSDDPNSLHPDMIRGIWFPFALAADRIIEHSVDAVLNNSTNGYLTQDERADNLWNENRRRRYWVRNPRVPPLPPNDRTHYMLDL